MFPLQPPTKPRGEIIYYVIEYRMHGVEEAVRIEVGSNRTSYVIGSLPELSK